jgi:hypothetical protein
MKRLSTPSLAWERRRRPFRLEVDELVCVRQVASGQRIGPGPGLQRVHLRRVGPWLYQAIDQCVQLFGGYGYMWDYPITRAYADARVQRIYGGTNEIMKEVISRGMGLGGR